MKKKLVSLTLSLVIAFAAFAGTASADAPLCADGTIWTNVYGCRPPFGPTWYEVIMLEIVDFIS
jgi:hypothetical protein